MQKYKVLKKDSILDTDINCNFGATHNNKHGIVYRAWLAAGNTPDYDANVLAEVKEKKIQEYKTEGVNRIQVHVPAWNSVELVGIIFSTWNMLGTPSAAQSSDKDIYVYVKNTAIPAVNAIDTGDVEADIATIQAIDVVNDPSFPS